MLKLEEERRILSPVVRREEALPQNQELWPNEEHLNTKALPAELSGWVTGSPVLGYRTPFGLQPN